MIENGPLRLVIQVFSGEVAETELAKEAAEIAFDCLARVAKAQYFLRKRHSHITLEPEDDIAATMLASVRRIGDLDLTPMAAVAGTIADFVADWLFSHNVTRVIVDNGGDIAIRLQEGEAVRVGIRPTIESREITHSILLDSRFSSWGVNTSGIGGRSLTRGIASAVTVFAESSSIADAAATAIANACFAEDENIHQVPARMVDPGSDLGDVLVTVSASGLSPKTIAEALNNGLEKALVVQRQGEIRGALLAVGGKYVQTPGFAKAVGELSPITNL
ncbi:FAD:protein FMN transferase [Desulfopila inferna]|uniref:FAD:protein FMN transferase n=1 Tax=Desulfopila inferna TaxID=468528 RepID=UPI00196354EC|nr:FAD:protein FMN transferase [Desulfopila inferna]